MGFEGKTVLVTGGGRGIGRTLARDFAAGGAAVVVNYAASTDGARKTVHDIEGAGGRAIAVGADIADAAAVNAMFDAARDAFGRVDILVNNAGINIDKQDLVTVYLSPSLLPRAPKAGLSPNREGGKARRSVYCPRNSTRPRCTGC